MNKGRQCSLRPETWRENWWMFWFSKDKQDSRNKTSMD